MKQSALAAGIMIREEEAGRVSLTMKAREYIRTQSSEEPRSQRMSAAWYRRSFFAL